MMFRSVHIMTHVAV